MLKRSGLSLVEVLVAAGVMGVLGFGVHDAMFATTRGVQVDRVAQARRQLTLDLLERFAQPYSDIEHFFPADPGSLAVREISVDDALRIVAVPGPERATIKSTLEAGSVRGFSLVWHRGLASGEGETARLRKDRLWVYTVTTARTPLAQAGSFRVFAVRGS